MIRGIDAVRAAYRDETVAAEYVERRFREPLGALLHARQVEHLTRLFRNVKPRRVLEIAPGPARLTRHLTALVPHGVTLVDASAQMLAEARRSLQRSRAIDGGLVQGDAFALPFAPVFDVVYTFRLIRHFETDNRERLYLGIAQLLKPGGLLVFDAVNEAVSGPIRRAAAPGEYRHFDALSTPQLLTEELDRAGLRVVSLEGVQRRYGVLSRLQVLVAPRSRLLARGAMEAVERWCGGEPLEWIVTCRRA